METTELPLTHPEPTPEVVLPSAQRADLQSQPLTSQATESGGWRGLFKGLVKKTFDNGVAPSQPRSEAAANTAPTISEVVVPQPISPLMEKINAAREQRTAGNYTENLTEPTITSEVAQVEITLPATSAIESTPTPNATPWTPILSQEFMDSIKPTNPGLLLRNKKYQVPEDAARTVEDMARQAEATKEAKRRIAAELDADLRNARPKNRIIGRRSSIGRASDTQPGESPITSERPPYDAAGHIDPVFATKPVSETPDQIKDRLIANHNALYGTPTGRVKTPEEIIAGQASKDRARISAETNNVAIAQLQTDARAKVEPDTANIAGTTQQ
jgi:hypothetical protein